MFTIQKEKIIYKKSPDTPILFFTVHKSKGLEADNVVLINFKNEKLGFPNQIADDDVLKLVLKENEDYIFSEERRLFYVAITRTKNRTFILTDANKPSIFFKDFEEYKNQITDKVCFIAFSKKTEEENCVYCPRCKSGLLYKVNSNGKTFIGCNNFPFCNYTVKDTSVLVNPVKCPECGGFLIKRRNKNSKHWFIGCTNYPFCEYTEKIKW